MKDALFPGTVLEEQRKSLGHSIYSASRKTHVPLEYIEAFEAGNFEKMPGRAYALGFLRSYCRFLDIDPEPFCDQYLICTQPPKVNGPFNFVRRGERTTQLEQAYPRWLNELINWGSVCVIIIIGWIAYTTIIRPVADSWKSRVDAGAMEIEVPVHFNEDL